MAFDPATLPKVALSRAQWLRLVFVLMAIGRVLPDAVRAVYPLHYFDYVTDGNAVVLRTDAKPPEGDDRISLGDRVRIDHIKAFDRKPGLAGASYSYDNPDRHLPARAVPSPFPERNRA